VDTAGSQIKNLASKSLSFILGGNLLQAAGSRILRQIKKNTLHKTGYFLGVEASCIGCR
jgi:hypothetical protein